MPWILQAWVNLPASLGWSSFHAPHGTCGTTTYSQPAGSTDLCSQGCLELTIPAASVLNHRVCLTLHLSPPTI